MGSVGNHLSVMAPELILLAGACATLLLGVTRTGARSSACSMLSFVVVVSALAMSIWQGEPDGSYASLGLWLTSVTYYVRCLALTMGVLVLLVNWHQPAAQERGEYMGLILFSLLGLLLTASANDLLVLFFAVELVSIPTYVLVALSRVDHRASEASVKYAFLGALAAALFAYGLSFLYGASGTTTIHAITDGLARTTFPTDGSWGPAMMFGVLLVLGGMAFKIAAFPFHVYAPDVYEGAASPMTGMLGFVPKLAGFLALIKIFTACNWTFPTEIMWILWLMAAASMTAGNVLALLQTNAKRMLAYSGVAHTGYMLIALLVGPVAGQGPMHDGVAALLFYIAVYGAMNLGAFALLSTFRVGQRPLETLDDLRGLATRSPAASLAMAICLFSLLGFPPTAGFLGKLYVFGSAFSLGDNHPFYKPMIALAIVGVVNAAIAAAYYLRLASAMYFGQETEAKESSGGWPVRLGLGLCGVSMLVVFAWPLGIITPAKNATRVVANAIHTSKERWATLTSESTSKKETISTFVHGATTQPISSDTRSATPR